ncbi:MAG: tetratricopeptide repeat protein [Spirochaetia bacterium]|nr:tetratricopeptide repeat protein [Spirochaetia bacterium]
MFVWSLNNNYRYKDFVLDTTISINKVNGHSAAGILFRYADELNYYYFMISENGYFRLDVVFNGTPQILIPWTPGKFQDSNEIRIKIIVHGVSITLFLDDIWIGEIDDESIDAGYIAFAGQNYSDKKIACFGMSKILIESRGINVEKSYQELVKIGPIPVENRKILAERLFDFGQYTAVLIQIKKALKNNPEDYAISILKAKTLSLLSFYDDALQELDLCHELFGSINKDIVVEKAGIFYRMNRFIELRDFLNTNAEILEGDSFLLNLMGNVEDALGGFDEAVGFYKKANNLDSDNGVYQLNIARTLEKLGEKDLAFSSYHNAALCFFRTEDFNELTQIILNMSKVKPGNKEGLILEGKILFQEERLPEAYSIFHKLLEDGLEDSSVSFLYGIILRDRGLDNEALDLFRECTMEEPEYYPYWFKYAETLYLMGQNSEDIVLEAIRLDSDNPWVHNLYGLVLMSEDRVEDAKLSFSRAYTLKNDSMDILINYSNAVSVVDGTEAAISLFTDRSIGLETPPVQNQIGNLLYDQEEYEKASDYYRAAVRADASNRTYKENLSSALIKQDYVLAAEEILSELMEEYLTSATLEMIAQVAFRKGEYERAETSFLEAIKLEPGNSRILLNYGDFLYTRLNYEGVSQVAEKVISISKNKRIKGTDISDAEVLIEKVKTALNEKYECSSCGIEWWVPKNIPVIDVVQLHGEPHGDSPAGKCKVCGKVYCVNCAVDHIRNSRFICPDCDEYLKLSENYLKFLAMEYVNR